MLDEQTIAPEAPVTEVPTTDEKLFTDEQFAHLGGGTLAYVRVMSSEDVQRVFPQAPRIEPGLRIFALLAADGSPILLSDSRETAIANALASNLEMVSLQ